MNPTPSVARARLLALTAFVVTAATGSSALAANYEVCIQAKVQNSDSEQLSPTGIAEDYYLTQVPQDFPARGVFVRITTGNVVLTSGYTDSNTGCISFEEDGPTYVSDVDVYSAARHGSVVLRAHDAGSASDSSAPGSWFVRSVSNVALAPGRRTVTLASNAEWNAFMTASYALWRVRTGISGSLISMGFGPDSSSSLLGDSENYVDEGRHLIHINEAHLRQKFVVAHELGHAVARLNFGENGTQDEFDSTYPYGGPATNGCRNINSYGLSSVEWDSMGFKEGYAHLYAARVFNDPEPDATFTLFGRTISTERFQSAALGNPQGGYLRNICDTTPDHGVSTIEDWTRFLWDIYTIPEADCGPKLGLDDMYDIYRATRDRGPTEANGFHTDVISAIQDLDSLSACEKDAAEEFANWNAIGGAYHTY